MVSGWLRMVSGDFGWFQVVCCFSSYDNTAGYVTLKGKRPKLKKRISVYSKKIFH